MVKNINTNITKTDQKSKAQTLNSRTKVKNQKYQKLKNQKSKIKNQIKN